MKGTENSNRKKVILVVNDPSIRALVKIMLQNNNYLVNACRNGMEAMVLLEKGNIPDVMLIDTDLPWLKGYDFVKNIKISGFFNDIPVLLLTNNRNNTELEEKCLQCGARDYIVKPFRPQELIEKIEQIDVVPIDMGQF